MEELIIKEKEFREKIVELINNSEIPAVMMKPTLKELYETLTLLEVQQYNNAIDKQKNIKEKKDNCEGGCKMSETTNIKLFKHDNPETNTELFDVTKSLNENWDKIDKYVYEQEAGRQSNEETRQENEEIRKEKEIERQTNENLRKEAENLREEYITNLKEKVDNGDFNGEPNILQIGEVTKGEEALAEIIGDTPNQILNLVLPKGDKGDKFTYQELSEDEKEELVSKIDANSITFDDGETYQYKYENGELKGDKGDSLTYQDLTESEKQDLVSKINAEDITFKDGETYQQKYENNEFKGDKGDKFTYQDLNDKEKEDLVSRIDAKNITFEDGQTYQEKYENGEFKGEKGDKFTYQDLNEAEKKELVSKVDANSITFEDGETYQEKYVRGEFKGEKGEDGVDGLSAGFGNVTANLKEEGEEPSVTVEVTGENTSKNFAFNFKNLKGKDGKDGKDGEITEESIRQILLTMNPVGSIIFNTTGTNPSNYIGGTWIEWGSGRVPVGVSNEDTTKKTAELEGGNKEISLKETNMPSHTHTFSGSSHSHGLGSHTHSYYHATSSTDSHRLTVDEIPSHYHSLITSKYGGYTQQASSSSGTPFRTDSTVDKNTSSTGGGLGHSHSISTSSYTTGSASGSTGSATTDGTIGKTGSGTAFNIEQPYITCYMWKRTA